MLLSKGAHCFLLHAHLPWFRDQQALNDYGIWWFYECLAESYLPLTNAFSGISNNQYELKFILSCSAPLLSMLSSQEICDGFERYLKSRIKLAKSEAIRNYYSKHEKAVCEHYQKYYSNILGNWYELNGDLISEWRKLSRKGHVDIIATSVSHSILPFLLDESQHLNNHIRLGQDAIQRCFGIRPKGFWLPECAWDLQLENHLLANGVEWVVLEPEPGIHKDFRQSHFATDSGLNVVLRHQDGARLIWDSQRGYPADSIYRDFHRDIGFECDHSYLSSFTPGQRTPEYTGIKLTSIDGNTYKPNFATERVKEHASDFFHKSNSWLGFQGDSDKDPFNVFAFDAELFGHWWFEGPEFLRSLNKLFTKNGMVNQSAPKWMTPTQFFQSQKDGAHSDSRSSLGIEAIASSWGGGRDYRHWINNKNISEVSKITLLRKKFLKLHACFDNNLNNSYFSQISELGFKLLYLLESSDWLFMISGDATANYGRSRIEDLSFQLESVCCVLENPATWDKFDFEQEWVSKIEGYLRFD